MRHVSARLAGSGLRLESSSRPTPSGRVVDGWSVASEGKLYCAVVLDVCARRVGRLTDRFIADCFAGDKRIGHGDRFTQGRS